jgi:shikimate kinase
MHIITKAMKLFSLPLITLLFVNVLLYAQAPTTWVVGTQYNSGSIVGYGDNFYRAIQDVPGSVGGTPDTLTDYWVDIFSTKPDTQPGDPPTTEPDPSDSDVVGNLTPPPSVSSVFGISCRAYIDDAPMVGGLTIRGSESKLVLVRAKGPSMQSVLPGKKMLPNPKIKIQKLNEETGVYSTVLQTNDYGDHESASAYSSEATGNALEPMIVTSLEPGVYSIKVQDQTSGETGNANLEIYGLNDDNSSSYFFGLSGRAYISDAPMVGGLTIKGSESMKIMIRAKGPSMQSVLPGKKMLPNPKVKVQKLNEETGVYSTVLQTNDYGDHESASEYSSEATGNNLEPMVVTSLEPGIYSIKVQDQTSGETGNTNLEIYSFD